MAAHCYYPVASYLQVAVRYFPKHCCSADEECYVRDRQHSGCYYRRSGLRNSALGACPASLAALQHFYLPVRLWPVLLPYWEAGHLAGRIRRLRALPVEAAAADVP
ncbi:MAG: hypothetical protein NVSMB58_16430 [Terriglobales bacterium]